MKIEIWSDIACPWCYIGKHRFETALDAFAHRDQVEVEWKSFELAPDMPAEQPLGAIDFLIQSKGLAPDRARQIAGQCAEAGAAEGLVLDFERSRRFNTGKAHELLHFAKDAGAQDALAERLFRATFSEGRELGRLDVLAELAADVGLDREAAHAALVGGGYRTAVLADEEQARAIGVSGVPFFVINGRYGISGAQDSRQFLQALEAIHARDEPQEAAGDVCNDEGCAL